MEREKTNLAQNLTTLRKSRKLTQLELAEILHYSDKSISKWENGDAVPDLDTIMNICDYFAVTMDALCRTQITTKQALHEQDQQTRRRRAFTQNKIIITLLSVLLVWSIATIAFAEIWFINDLFYWQAFVWAIPLSCILLLIFSSIWGNKVQILLSVSALIWTSLMALHVNFVQYEAKLWLIYFIGIPAQAAVLLSSKFEFKRSK